MTRRTKIFTLITIILVLLILILILVSFLKKEGKPLSKKTLETVITTPLPPITIPTIIEPAPIGPQEQNPSIIASDFAERYGSYSNQGSYQNLRDLFSQMTDQMISKTESMIASNPLLDGEYNGVTTKVIKTTVDEKTEIAAQITVSAQRIETTETNPNGRVFYQNAKLKLVKDNLKWLVDSFEWQ